MTQTALAFDASAGPSDADRFNTYVPRMTDTQRAVFLVLWRNREEGDGKPISLRELHRRAMWVLGRALEITPVSAKARDLRKVPCGDWPVMRVRLTEGGTHAYYLGDVGDAWTAVKARGAT